MKSRKTGLQKNNYLNLYFSVGIFTIAWSFINTNILEVGDNCGFDGRIYCLMAKGEVAFEPYSRRTALPFLVGLFDFKDTYLGFYLINSIFLIFSIILLNLIIKKINSKYRILILSIFLVNPHTFRMLFSAPVLVDFLALMLILLLIYLSFKNRSIGTEIFLLAILTFLVFVRENLSITYIFSLFIVNLLEYYRHDVSIRKVVLAFFEFIYILIITYLAFLQPKIDPPNYVPKTEILEVIKYWFLETVASGPNFLRVIFLTVFGLGIFGIIGITNYKFLFQNSTQIKILYLFSIMLTLSSIFLGGDTARILLIPSVIFTLIYFMREVDSKNLTLFFVLALVLWVPWAYSTGSEESFLTIYGQRYLSPNIALSQFAQFLALGLLISGVYFFRKVPRFKSGHQ